MSHEDSPDPRSHAASGDGPPPAGMARSIRDLFGEVTPEARPASAPHADETSTARERFTRQVAEYLTAVPSERPSLEEGIREEAHAVRADQGMPVIADAIILLTLHDADQDDAPLRLAHEFMDPGLASHLSARTGTDRDPESRERLARVAQSHPDLMAPALADALADAPDRGIRRALMDALRGLGLPGQNAVLRLLEDPRWFAVRNGIVLLSELEDPSVVPSLTVPLAHSDPRVRKEAVMAIARIGGEDAGLLILGMLEDADPDVRAAAVMGVGELRVEKAQRQLQTMLEKDDHEAVQLQVLRALGQLGDPGAVQGIEKRAVGSMFSKPPRPIRIAAYRALAAIGTPHARKVLDAALSDRDQEVREAVESLFKQNPRLSAGAPEG